MRWLSSLDGQRVALTGKAWRPRKDLLQKLDGKATPGGRVTKDTTVLVRGSSVQFAYGQFGRKERYAAKLLRSGQKLVVVDDLEFRKLLEDGRRARLSDWIAGQPIQWLLTVPERQFRRIAEISGPLDREYSARGRAEQCFLRKRLVGDADTLSCALCGKLLPTELLVAAHIKPRSECSRLERLDADNIVFGGGFDDISIALKGALRVFAGRKCTAWQAGKNEKYFAWHAERRFQGR